MQVTYLTHMIIKNGKTITVSVLYDPFTNTVEEITRIVFTELGRRITMVLPTDGIAAMMAEGMPWGQIYMQEQEARDYERACHLDPLTDEEIRLLNEHYYQQEQALNTYNNPLIEAI